MSFISLIFKNIFRNKIRTALTVLSISIGIAAIVSLVIFTEGTKDSIGKMLKAGDADFMITQKNAADMIVSTISEDRVKEIQEMEGIKDAVGVSMGVIQQQNLPFFMMFGVEGKYLNLTGAHITEGTKFNDNTENEIILGKIGASNLKKGLNDIVNIGGNDYKIVGIYETGNPMIDGGSFAPLEVSQKQFKREGKISMIFVKVGDGENIDSIAQKIESKYPDELVTIKSVDEINKADSGVDIMNGLTWAITLLSIIIGGMIIANTMIMSVFERTREIGVLRALGWKRIRVVQLILGESFLVGIMGTIVGIILSIIAINLIMLSPTIKGFIEPSYNITIFIRAFVIGIILALIGGLYPAIKASKLLPIEALRYE
jgi:putative ABC transport system permease protein